MTTFLWLLIVFIVGAIAYHLGFSEGFDYAKVIALGLRRVKKSKDYMRKCRNFYRLARRGNK